MEAATGGGVPIEQGWQSTGFWRQTARAAMDDIGNARAPLPPATPSSPPTMRAGTNCKRRQPQEQHTGHDMHDRKHACAAKLAFIAPAFKAAFGPAPGPLASPQPECRGRDADDHQQQHSGP